MTEPDVTLTDYGLAIECAIFVWMIRRRASGDCPRAPWIILFFVSVSVASLTAGTMHGFFHDPASAVHALLWPVSLLAIGLTALSGWVIGARMILNATLTRWVAYAAVAQFVVYAGVVLFLNDAFWVAIGGYLPATLFLLIAFILTARRGGGVRTASVGAWGLALSLVAAGLQYFRIALHPVYFNHNALYHVVQAIALYFIFRGLSGLLHPSGGSHADAT